MKDLEVGNGEPSQRVGPRREQRTHDDVVDTVPVDRGGTAVVVADRRRETGFDPAGETVLGGLDIGRDRGIATISARIDLETERAIDAEVVPVGDKDEGTTVRGRAEAGDDGGTVGGDLKPVEALAGGGVEIGRAHVGTQ